MNREYPSYSVAIRTLGTAGDKYQETLDSVARQTVQPEKVLVCIPSGYDLPKETIGREEFIRSEKGMVAQRALPFNEIPSEFILFLDDDLSFEARFVEKLFDGLLDNNGDCICPDIYREHEKDLLIRIRDFLGGTRPHSDKDWSFKIRLDGHYSYNRRPFGDVLLAQSGAGASCLCRKLAFKAIHFEDERWLDAFSFGLCEDQLLYYKLYKYRYKLLTAFNAKIVHLDAASGHDSNNANNYKAQGFCREMVWYRTIFSQNDTQSWHFRCRWARLLSRICSFPLSVATVIKHKSLMPVKARKEGEKMAERFARSAEYQKIPSYFEYF